MLRRKQERKGRIVCIAWYLPCVKWGGDTTICYIVLIFELEYESLEVEAAH